MAKGVVAEIRAAGGDALFIRLDVTDAASWHNAIAAAVEAFGGLTTLSNTAGIIHPGGSEEESIERSEERRVGKEFGSTCSSRWSPKHEHKKLIDLDTQVIVKTRKLKQVQTT